MKLQSTSEELPLSSPSLFEGTWPGFSFLWILAAWNCRWSILKLLWAGCPLMCKRFWGMLTPHFCSPFFSPQESNWLVPISAYLVKSSGFGTISQIRQQALFLPGTTHCSFTKGDVKPEELPGLCLCCPLLGHRHKSPLGYKTHGLYRWCVTLREVSEVP